jgi:hypothetical protein
VQDDVEVKIGIIRKSIYMYETYLDTSEFSEEILIEIKTRLEKEKKKLSWYKENYSEYFI